jgi:cytoskeletal protein RodZ
LPPVTTYTSSVNPTQVQNNSATVGAGQVGERRYKDEGEFLCGKWGWILLALLILALLTLALLYGLGILGGTPSKRVSSSGSGPVSPFPSNNTTGSSSTTPSNNGTGSSSTTPSNYATGSSSTTNHPSGQNGKINGQTKPTPVPINNQTGNPSTVVNINKLID